MEDEETDNEVVTSPFQKSAVDLHLKEEVIPKEEFPEEKISLKRPVSEEATPSLSPVLNTKRAKKDERTLIETVVAGADPNPHLEILLKGIMLFLSIYLKR